MTDSVYTSVHRVKPAVSDAREDGLVREPAPTEFVDREDSPILGRQLGNPHVRPSVDFLTLTLINSTLGGHAGTIERTV
jgi:hypothetical protein